LSIIVSGIRIGIDDDDNSALEMAKTKAGVSDCSAAIYKKSIDARHGTITKVISVILNLYNDKDEQNIIADKNDSNIRQYTLKTCEIKKGSKNLGAAPIVIGFGPAGIFAALTLARNGYRPIVLEKGDPIDKRDAATARFFSGGEFDKRSNIQFGEGGAGAYSDGKLTTRIGDARCDAVLQELCRHGAPDDILRAAKPHIGTDLLKGVIKSIRKEIVSLGGSVYFDSAVTDFEIKNGSLRSVVCNGERIPCEVAVLATGHSARDIFRTLYGMGAEMQQKAFAMGARIEHRQKDIDRALYGKFAGHKALPPGEYMLTFNSGKRPCYTFCMCPGGNVVAAASEEGTVVTNGMSAHKRDGENANSAVVVAVSPEDIGSRHPLAAMEYQIKYEKMAFEAGGNDYKAISQTVSDFLLKRGSCAFPDVLPTYPRGVAAGRIDDVLPSYITDTMREAILNFGKKIKGFDSPGAVLTGPETRTSSPVRILRDKWTLESLNISGLIPCGEGAGYAGGIMSAAVDGIRAAEVIISKFAPVDRD